MILYTHKYDVLLLGPGRECDVRKAYAIELDPEYKRDMERCKEALEARFPHRKVMLVKCDTAVYQLDTAVYQLQTDVLPIDPSLKQLANDDQLEMRSFAEGFMASAHLWER